MRLQKISQYQHVNKLYFKDAKMFAYESMLFVMYVTSCICVITLIRAQTETPAFSTFSFCSHLQVFRASFFHMRHIVFLKKCSVFLVNTVGVLRETRSESLWLLSCILRQQCACWWFAFFHLPYITHICCKT